MLFRSAQIGIYSPNGKKVGRVSHLRNKEYLFVVSDRRELVTAVCEAIEASIEEAALASKPAKGKKRGHESERRAER